MIGNGPCNTTLVRLCRVKSVYEPTNLFRGIHTLPSVHSQYGYNAYPQYKSKKQVKSVYEPTNLFHGIHTLPSVHSQYGYALYPQYKSKKQYITSLTQIISDYSLKGKIECARNVFDQMVDRDSVSWNVIIKCYIQNNRIGDARGLFDKMPERTSVSWNSMIMAYNKENKIHIALKLFLVMPCKDVVSWTAIITALCQASRVEDAWRLFKEMPEPNSVSWSSIVSGFQQNGFSSESLIVFKEMISVGIQPTSHSFTSALAASADLAMISVCEQLYAQLLNRGFGSNICIVNSAISMFMKSGSFHSASQVFHELPEPDLVTWNSMITGYAQHGYGMEALMMFHQMQKANFCLDGISFLSVLHGCSHCGFVEVGKRLFRSMETDYGISPGPEHFASMIDLLARSGLLKEAYHIIMQMPFGPTSIFWRTLLNGCRIWGNMELGVYAANMILELEPYNSSACLMAIDIYALAGRWKEVAHMRRQMKQIEAKKELGCSWIDINGKSNLFTTRDDTHSEFDHLYQTLKLLYYDAAECFSI